MSPAISVVVPVRDGEATIEACLRSLLTADAPTGGIEVIVVDNGSKDATARIVRSFPVRLLSASHGRGSYYARNTGAAVSTGPVIAFTDADCEVHSRWITTGLARFSDPEVGLVAGKIEAGTAQTRASWYQCRTSALDQEKALRCSPLPYAQTANCLVRRETFEGLGGFDVTFLSGGDADFCWRLSMLNRWSLVYDPACKVIHRHRATWRAVFNQTLAHTGGLLALEEKHAALFKERSLPLKSQQGLTRAFSHATLALGGRGAALLWAFVRGRHDSFWQRYGDLVRSAAFHTALCGRKLGIA